MKLSLIKKHNTQLVKKYLPQCKTEQTKWVH